MIHQTNWVHAPINSKKRFKIHLLVFLLATPAIWLWWQLTGSTSPWHLWAIAAWTKVLQVHFLRAIVSKLESYQKLKLWISSKIHPAA
ncbi:2TM domain-containing protein [Dyadobacter fanqingshengii]|uniref:2TM domain-containing protein n=1 Tax=Dyadobacter fanqingshengii TaxID=2906443 RepID=UPI0035B65CF1